MYSLFYLFSVPNLANYTYDFCTCSKISDKFTRDRKRVHSNDICVNYDSLLFVLLSL